MSVRRGLLVLIVAGVAASAFLAAPVSTTARTPPLTYHTADTLICSSCHTMHFSEGGAAPPGSEAGGPFPHLLLRRNQTDLCLLCHAGTSGPNVMGGNWPAGTFPGVGAEGKGHNPTGTIANQSTQIPLDPVLQLTPPGGSGPLTEFACTTCHDPHGYSDYTAGNADVFTYRLLRKHIKGPGGIDVDVSTTLQSTFGDEQPLEAASETNHNVYRAPASISDATKGFGQWCASCHGTFHSTGADWRHPTAQQIGSFYTNYTAANAADGYAGGTYFYKYPVETSQGTLATTGAQWSITSGTTERVFCLTCHKAHGTTYANAGRWDFASKSGDLTNCNKCHGKGK